MFEVGYALSSEEHHPNDLVQYARRAEETGFTFALISDHYHPWIDGQGHLHYQVDSGPVIATTATKLSFHELSPGQHKILVMLVGNDHQPLGVQETRTVTIPKNKGDRAQRR